MTFSFMFVSSKGAGISAVVRISAHEERWNNISALQRSTEEMSNSQPSPEAARRAFSRARTAAANTPFVDPDFAVFRYDEDIRPNGNRWYTFEVRTAQPALSDWHATGSMIIRLDGQIMIESFTLKWAGSIDGLAMQKAGMGSAQTRAIRLSQIMAYERALAAASVSEEHLLATIGDFGLHPDDLQLKTRVIESKQPQGRRSRNLGDNTLKVAIACLRWERLSPEQKPRSVYTYLVSSDAGLFLSRSTCEKAIIRARDQQLLAPARRQGARDGFRAGPLLATATKTDASRSEPPPK